MSQDFRPVRFICTDEDQHKRQVLATVRLTVSSVEHVRVSRSSAPFNRDGHGQLRRQWREQDNLGPLPDFDLLCFKCGRNPRLNAARMREVLQAVLSVYADTPTVVVDISGPVGRMIV